MKAIVANVLFGGIFGCLSWTNSAIANPINQSSPTVTKPPIVSAKLLEQDLPISSPVLSLIDRVLTVNKSDSFGDVDRRLIIFQNGFDSHLNFKARQNPSLGKSFYTHQNEQSNLILGFQNTFWPSTNKHKYWGVTTVEHWGDSDRALNLSRLNYTDSAPILSLGSSALTVSGGGNNNLVKRNIGDRANSSQEFEEFRGGVTYHHGIAKDLTMGAGFVYEDFLIGFTQLTYQSDIFPVRTTLSLLAKESKINLHSHVRFQPANNFVVNYYNDEEKHKFDLNWGVISGLTLVAKGDSNKESYNTGLNIVVHNDYLKFSATAALDNNLKLQWKLNSQIGSFKFAHSNNKQKSISELNVNLFDSKSFGFQCSAFIKYQTRELKKEQEGFLVWGGELHSTKKVGSNKYHWTLDLGYGSGSKGKGLIANGSLALDRDLFLKLSYQEISSVSDDTKVKLQLGSN